ncbi:MAG: NADH-quinone oxidoreductase subunit J [Deltaproteobacteria bacterium]|nr:NADH-quinone oxidoreductase subunit J [Deltaproteobacteria bacterium]
MSGRVLAAIAALFLVLGLVAAGTAAAQPAGGDAPSVTIQATPGAGVSTASRDIATGSGAGMAILFWALALGTVGGAAFVLTRRNLIAAVMGMVGTFLALAGLYMMLYASFLAVIQMLVYAGAIMVLFVFVIMVLNRPEDEPWGMVGLPGKALAGLAMLYLLVRLVMLVWSVNVPDTALVAPAAVAFPGDAAHTVYEFGSTAAVGTSLFSDYLFPFEAISILLLIAVVGAIAVARPLNDADELPGAQPPAPTGGH